MHCYRIYYYIEDPNGLYVLSTSVVGPDVLVVALSVVLDLESLGWYRSWLITQNRCPCRCTG